MIRLRRGEGNGGLVRRDKDVVVYGTVEVGRGLELGKGDPGRGWDVGSG